MANALEEALKAEEVPQKPSPAGLAGKHLFCVALSQQATSLPSKARLAEQFSYLPEPS